MNAAPMNSILWLVGLCFIVSIVGTYFYRAISIRKGIIANPNYRTLHVHPIPRGGGLVFSQIFVLIVIILWLMDIVSYEIMMALGVGGGLASLLGFIDDVANIRAFIKLIFQGCLAAWILVWFDGGPVTSVSWLPVWVAWLISWLLLIWLINLYNFMDGVDGMASSGAIYICVVLASILYISDGPFYLITLFLLLAASCLGFLLFNWPPASIFMGDSGSVFLGYCFGVFIFATTMNSDVSFWTWLVVLGYFAGDTTTTTTLRVLTVKKWYGAHRSNAYQNLARMWGSHMKVTGGVLIYHVIWLLPLAVWSNLQSEFAPIAAALALLPSIIWAFRFGPLLSST